MTAGLVNASAFLVRSHVLSHKTETKNYQVTSSTIRILSFEFELSLGEGDARVRVSNVGEKLKMKALGDLYDLVYKLMTCK